MRWLKRRVGIRRPASYFDRGTGSSNDSAMMRDRCVRALFARFDDGAPDPDAVLTGDWWSRRNHGRVEPRRPDGPSESVDAYLERMNAIGSSESIDDYLARVEHLEIGQYRVFRTNRSNRGDESVENVDANHRGV